jgi:hypothetical protein
MHFLKTLLLRGEGWGEGVKKSIFILELKAETKKTPPPVFYYFVIKN